jgi:hypothetical protein
MCGKKKYLSDEQHRKEIEEDREYWADRVPG